MRTITIPGGTALLREREEIKVRHRRLIEAASVAAASAVSKLPQDNTNLDMVQIASLDLTAAEANSLFALQDATIIATLESWTLPDPIPTLDTIGDLDPGLYDAVAEATREEGQQIAAKVDFEPADPTAPGFDATPTEPSAASDSGLRADTEPAPAGTQSSGSESTSTATSST